MLILRVCVVYLAQESMSDSSSAPCLCSVMGISVSNQNDGTKTPEVLYLTAIDDLLTYLHRNID